MMGHLKLVQTPPLIEIVPAEDWHIRELRDTLRERDKEEIESFGLPIARALWRSYKSGIGNTTGLIDGRVGAMWGVGGSYMGGAGTPWLLTSNIVNRIPAITFARIYFSEVAKMLEVFTTLEGMVYSKYEGAIRMLKLAGFTVGEPEQFGKSMFCKFSLVRE